MPDKKRFQCPYCQAIFAVKPLSRRFACPRCGHAFATVRLDGRRRGWIALPQVAWERAHSQVVRPFPGRGELHAAPAAKKPPVQPASQSAAGELPVPMGAARRRRQRRRVRRRLALPMALVGLAAALIVLLFYPHGAGRVEARGPSDLPVDANPSAAALVGTAGLRIETNPSAASVGVDGIDPGADPTPTLAGNAGLRIETNASTATPTPTPTPTATPTPLPPYLAQATAWQATLDQAAAASHATQTLVAANYAATQTALPPTLTAMAQDRQATATQIAVQATQKAAGPGAR